MFSEVNHAVIAEQAADHTDIFRSAGFVIDESQQLEVKEVEDKDT